MAKYSFFTKFKHDFCYLCVIALLFSFVGFVIENVVKVIATCTIDNCNYILPFNAAYGLMAFLFHIIGKPYTPSIFGIEIIKSHSLKTKIISNIIYFIILFGLILGGEIAIGYFWHLVIHVDIFDYSKWALHITKYAEFFTTLGITTLFYLFLKFVYHPILNMMREKHRPREMVGGAIFYFLLIGDLTYGFVNILMSEDKKGTIYWSLNLTDGVVDVIALVNIILIVLFYAFITIFIFANLKYFTVKKYTISKKNSITKFAIFIAARNESKVIASTLRALYDSSYPHKKYDIYVMVQEPDDPTIEIYKVFSNVYCYVRETTDQGKGYVLDEIVKKLLKENRVYDAYLVLDADNIVEYEYLARMNDAFLDGFDFVVGNRNNKNWNSSATSGASGLTFSIINFQNELKTRFGEMVLLIGTGFCIKASIINSLGGWPFHSLTEDYEISKYAEENKLTSCYVSDAIFYDEQPIHLKDSIKQRTRWVKGFMDNQKGLKKMNLQGFSAFGAAIAFIAFVLYNLVLSIIELVTGKGDVRHIYFVIASISFYYIVVFVISLIIFLLDRKNNDIKPIRAILVSLYHPIFLATYIISFFRMFKKKGKTWEVIPHSVTDKEK
jgi:cellulose synthase/poly-beta-1,6-N-acetylglucosamine synthase-like glycosyltransferase